MIVSITGSRFKAWMLRTSSLCTVSGFLRTRVLVLEPHILVSNQTGMDIELRQPPNSKSISDAQSSSTQSILADCSCSPLQWGLGRHSQMILAQAQALGSNWSTSFGIQYPHVGKMNTKDPINIFLHQYFFSSFHTQDTHYLYGFLLLWMH